MISIDLLLPGIIKMASRDDVVIELRGEYICFRVENSILPVAKSKFIKLADADDYDALNFLVREKCDVILEIYGAT